MEQHKLYRIGEVARMFRLSVGSLRHYETMGILPPAYVDPESGYRYYSTQQFECLNTIRYLRMLDFSLEQIAATLGFSSQSHFGQVFKRFNGITPGTYRTQHQSPR